MQETRGRELVMLREIASKVRDRVLHEKMERMEKQMENRTVILHELCEEQRRMGEMN